jgi:hypothetical protein
VVVITSRPFLFGPRNDEARMKAEGGRMKRSAPQLIDHGKAIELALNDKD